VSAPDPNSERGPAASAAAHDDWAFHSIVPHRWNYLETSPGEREIAKPSVNDVPGAGGAPELAGATELSGATVLGGVSELGGATELGGAPPGWAIGGGSALCAPGAP
jgi:hypothetical protein